MKFDDTVNSILKEGLAGAITNTAYSKFSPIRWIMGPFLRSAVNDMEPEDVETLLHGLSNPEIFVDKMIEKAGPTVKPYRRMYIDAIKQPNLQNLIRDKLNKRLEQFKKMGYIPQGPSILNAY